MARQKIQVSVTGHTQKTVEFKISECAHCRRGTHTGVPTKEELSRVFTSVLNAEPRTKIVKLVLEMAIGGQYHQQKAINSRARAQEIAHEVIQGLYAVTPETTEIRVEIIMWK